MLRRCVCGVSRFLPSVVQSQRSCRQQPRSRLSSFISAAQIWPQCDFLNVGQAAYLFLLMHNKLLYEYRAVCGGGILVEEDCISLYMSVYLCFSQKYYNKRASTVRVWINSHFPLYLINIYNHYMLWEQLPCVKPVLHFLFQWRWLLSKDTFTD